MPLSANFGNRWRSPNDSHRQVTERSCSSLRANAASAITSRAFIAEPTAAGKPGIVGLGRVNRQRIRRNFPTMAEAKTLAEQARVARENEGTAAFALSQEIRVAAAKCLERLAPYSATLTEAVDYYVDHVFRYRTPR